MFSVSVRGEMAVHEYDAYLHAAIAVDEFAVSEVAAYAVDPAVAAHIFVVVVAKFAPDEGAAVADVLAIAKVAADVVALVSYDEVA